MKKIPPPFILIALIGGLMFSGSNAYCQETELQVTGSMGLFRFKGASAEADSYINIIEDESGYTNNPFGSRPGLSWSGTATLQRVTKPGVVLGVEAGYVFQQSKTNIIGVMEPEASTPIVTGKGSSNLTTQGLVVFPHLGYQVSINTIKISVITGLEPFFISKGEENGSAKADGVTYRAYSERNSLDTDIRGKIQIGLSRGKFGVQAGYIHGLANYRDGYVGGTNLAFGRLILLGVSYSLWVKD